MYVWVSGRVSEYVCIYACVCVCVCGESVSIGSCAQTIPRLATPLQDLLEDPQTAVEEEEEEEEEKDKEEEEEENKRKGKQEVTDAIGSGLDDVREGEARGLFRALQANRQRLCRAWHEPILKRPLYSHCLLLCMSYEEVDACHDMSLSATVYQ